MNICEIEDNYKYQRYHTEAIRFIDQHLQKPNQYLIKVAYGVLKKMDTEFEKALQELSNNVSIGQRLDQNLDHVWREYHEARKQIKQIKSRLWDIESHEERLVELDDWREEEGFSVSDSSRGLQNLCNKIDAQNAKIMKYTRLDIDLKWSLVDKDIKTNARKCAYF